MTPAQLQARVDALAESITANQATAPTKADGAAWARMARLQVASIIDRLAELTPGSAAAYFATPVTLGSKELAEHPVAKANAASWPTGPKKRKAKG